MTRPEAIAKVTSVLTNLTYTQNRAAYAVGVSTNGFHHGGYWFGPGSSAGPVAMCACVVASSFLLAYDANPATSWWGAVVEPKAFDAYNYLLTNAGGDAGADQFVMATQMLSNQDIVDILDAVLPSHADPPSH